MSNSETSEAPRKVTPRAMPPVTRRRRHFDLEISLPCTLSPSIESSSEIFSGDFDEDVAEPESARRFDENNLFMEAEMLFRFGEAGGVC